ncbi:MAG: hypothetical protein LBF88_09550 [Planctomycetaceae bacterium]|nr:hypothetical protein [Planctomycetaceae bacterium]
MQKLKLITVGVSDGTPKLLRQSFGHRKYNPDKLRAISFTAFFRNHQN